MFDSEDRYDQLCTKCGMGRYHETSIHDDWDGVLHCTNKKCNHEVKRYKWKDNPPPKPEKVELSPAAKAVYNAVLEISPAPADEIAATALRAAADQIMPKKPEPKRAKPTAAWHRWNITGKLRLNLLTIADELEGVKYGTYRCDLKEK